MRNVMIITSSKVSEFIFECFLDSMPPAYSRSEVLQLLVICATTVTCLQVRDIKAFAANTYLALNGAFT